MERSSSSVLARDLPSGVRSPAIRAPVAGSTTSPQAFTAATAPQTSSPAVSTSSPRPLFMARVGPPTLPTVQPVPAPTLPRGRGSPVPSSARRAARAPSSAVGRTWGSPQARSKTHAPETIGTTPTPTSSPMPWRSSSSATPQDAARPYAEPPESTTAFSVWTVSSGRRRSVSRVAGAPPRTSTPPVAPLGQMMTVQPVPASALVACAA